MPKPSPRSLAPLGFVAGMLVSGWLACAEKAPPPLYPDVPPPVLAEPIGKPTVLEIYGAGASSVEAPPPPVTQAGQMLEQPAAVAPSLSESATAPAVQAAPEQTPSAAPASNASVKPARVNRKKASQRSSKSRPQGQPRER